MALFKPLKGLSSQLSSLPIREGQFIITTDDSALYIDVSNSKRVRIDHEFKIVETLPTTNIDTNAVYLIKVGNTDTYNQYIYDGSKWSDISLGTKYSLSLSGTTLTLVDDNTGETVSTITIPAGEVNKIEKIKVNNVEQTITSKTVNISVPTKTSDLTNDSNYVADASYVHTDNNYTSTEKTKLSGIATGAQVNKIETIKVNGTAQTISSKAVDISVPTKTSQITNDSGFITKSVNNLDNYTTTTDLSTLLGNKLDTSLKGANNGLAELDSTGKVPSGQLPSYVDDVLEYDSQSSFPTTGETGKIYVDKTTNKTYRWGGSSYVEISPSLALGETSSTAYRGDRGKIAYDHSQSTHARIDATKTEASETNGNIKINGTETTVYTHPGTGTNPHGTTASDVGLGNVGNFKAVSTVANQGLSSTEKSNARANIGAGTSSLTLGTSSTTAYRGDYGNTAYSHATDANRLTTAQDSGLYKIATTAQGHIKSVTAVEKADITALGIPGSDTNTTYSLTQDSTDGHKITLTPSSGTAQTITIPDNNTTYTFATGTTNGTISVTPSGGTASNVAVKGLGSIAYKSSLTKSDVGLSNVDNTADASKSVSYAATAGDASTVSGFTVAKSVPSDAKFTDTTYESKAAASGGTAVSLVTTGEKYTWNNKGTYSKPSGGIPATDLTEAVQTSLSKADTALQSETYTGTITKVQANGTDVASSGTANIPAATTSKYGVTKLSSATDSTSEALAATPKAVKAAYDLAAGKGTGTITGVSVNGTSVATSGVANITSVPASILSGAIPSAVTATTQTQGDNSTKIATTAYVDTAIDNLPEPMVFKGSLGTGGTITALPVDGTANIGDTYKVITAGTYASKAAKVGDTFICLTKTSSANTWELIPSGDEPAGTVTSVTIKATSPISIDSSSAITSSGTRTLSHANSGVTAGTYKSVTVNATGHVTAGTNPTTISGYGITDAKIASGTITLGSNTITPLTSASTLDATKLSGTIPSGCYTNTKNTAGSTDSSSKLFLIGATSQAANPQTYSQDTAYVGTDGKLYSNSKEVVNLSDTQALTNKTYNGYTLAAASAKAVDTSISAGSSSANLPTSAAVATFVEGKGYVTTDTKNTAGSTDTSSKIYLIGATSQAANPQTYSDNEVYATSGVLTAKEYALGTNANIVYNSTDKCIEFNFA